MRILLLTLFLGAAFQAGCTATIRPGESGARHYFGYVRVKTPAPDGVPSDFGRTESTAVGLRFWPSAGFGYFHEQADQIPLDCRLVVRVRNRDELDHALLMLEPLLRRGLCVIQED